MITDEEINDKTYVRHLILEGTPCYYRYGYAFKGAFAKPISKEKALELLPAYSPGMGFYELCVEKNSQTSGKEAIVFNEYSASDLM